MFFGKLKAKNEIIIPFQKGTNARTTSCKHSWALMEGMKLKVDLHCGDGSTKTVWNRSTYQKVIQMYIL